MIRENKKREKSKWVFREKKTLAKITRYTVHVVSIIIQGDTSSRLEFKVVNMSTVPVTIVGTAPSIPCRECFCASLDGRKWAVYQSHFGWSKCQPWRI